MNVIRLGIIGTGQISKDFVEAARLSNRYVVTAVYGRSAESAGKFAADMGIIGIYTNIDQFCESDVFDVAYIGTPNSTHFLHALTVIRHGKHVIVEKPSFSTTKEWDRIDREAALKGCLVFEAARHLHERNFQLVEEWISEHRHELDGAVLSFAKYSSKYDSYLAGNRPNIFTTEFAGGAIADLGVYPLYAAVDWFGIPHDVEYFVTKLESGVDAIGVAILHYNGFMVTIHVGKNINMTLPSEIYFGRKTLRLDNISMTQSIELLENGEVVANLEDTPAAHYMLGEVSAFADVIENREDELQIARYTSWRVLSRQVLYVLKELRHKGGILFPADEVENMDSYLKEQGF